MRTRLTPLVTCAALALCSVTPVRAQTELRLWPGRAPGSEHWSIPESVTTIALRRPRHHERQRSDADRVPAGRGDSDGRGSRDRAGRRAARARVRQRRRQGRRVAQRARHRRLRAQVPHAAAGPVGAARPVAGHAATRRGPRQELVIVNANANPAPDDAALGEVLELAVADAQAALALVRSRASEWRIDPDARRHHRLLGRRRRRGRHGARSRSPTRRPTSSSPSTGRRCKT